MGIWNASLYAWMYGQVILDMYIPHSHQLFLLYMSVASVIHQTKKPHVSLYTLENVPLIKRLQSAL